MADPGVPKWNRGMYETEAFGEGFLPGCIFKEDELDGPTLT